MVCMMIYYSRAYILLQVDNILGSAQMETRLHSTNCRMIQGNQPFISMGDSISILQESDTSAVLVALLDELLYFELIVGWSCF